MATSRECGNRIKPRVTTMDDATELELHVDDEMVAGVSGQRDQAYREMIRYWAQYCEDGKCTVYEVHRTQINIEDVLGLERRPDNG